MSKIIFICHPWRGKSKSAKSNKNPALTRKVCKYLSLNTKNIPLSTGLYLNAYLDDDVDEERKLGIRLGHEIMEVCDMVYSYEMHGISEGMNQDLAVAKKLHKPIRHFKKYPWEKN